MRTARLGDVCEIVSGATPRTNVPGYWGGDIPWITPKDLSEFRSKHIGATARSLTAEGLRSCSAVVLPANSVLLSSRAPIGLVAINTVPMATNQGFKSFVPDPNLVISDYLYWWLRGNTRALQSLGRGATFAEVSKSIVADIEFPLPPIEEQRRIAAVLDQADDLRTKRHSSLALLDSLNEAIFLDMFGDRRTNRLQAPVVPLVDLVNPANPVTRGIDQPGPDVEGGVPYIKTTDIGGPIGQASLARAAPEIAAKFPRSVVQTGDCVICIRATVGPVVLVDEALSGVNLSRGTARISPAPGVEPRYLLGCLQSADFQNQIHERLRGATFLQIPLGELKQLRVLWPEQAAQREYARRVASAEATRRAGDRHLTELEALFSSLQHRAFAGQL